MTRTFDAHDCAHSWQRRRKHGHIVGCTPGVFLDTGPLSSDDTGRWAHRLLLYAPHSGRLRWSHGAPGDPLPALWRAAERVLWRPLSEPDAHSRLRQPRCPAGGPTTEQSGWATPTGEAAAFAALAAVE